MSWFKKMFLFSFQYHPGPESGQLNSTKTWKNSSAKSVESPFVAQGDLGYFNYKNKSYGAFCVFVNTYSKYVLAIPVPNKKSVSLIAAVGTMKKVGTSLLPRPIPSEIEKKIT